MLFLNSIFKRALWNQAEVEMIVDLCSELIKVLHSESVGIITPYRKQKGEIQRGLQERLKFVFTDKGKPPHLLLIFP